MSAVVTDQFRIFNASNFVESVLDISNSYYVFLGLSNPASPNPGFGRTNTWDSSAPLLPTDNLSYEAQYRSTSLFGQKINANNIRRVIRKVQWTSNTSYDMYRQDYSISNPSPVSKTARLYDANYYVVNSDFNVYICLSNGSYGAPGSTTAGGGKSKDEPTFTDLEPSAAGTSGDGYVWKFLFSISPSDIIKFDSTEYIVVPNDWSTSTNSQIQNVREAADSDVNFNQIKQVYIENPGAGYNNGTFSVDILGDGAGAKASVQTVGGIIQSVTVTAGGSGYTYGIVDLGLLQPTGTAPSTFAKLIPIIPPSRGHGYDVYKELGADRVLIYARFDDSTKDFPTDTKFSQIGIVKNPTTVGTANTYTTNDFSSLQALKLSTITGTPTIGEKIVQTTQTNQIAEGYIASWDKKTQVLKYFRDRSLNYTTTNDQTDYAGISTSGRIYEFESTANVILGEVSNFSANIDTGFSGISTNPTGTKLINLGTTFKNGLSDSEINKGSGDIIYLDNRPLIARNERQKEDVKIILEF